MSKVTIEDISRHTGLSRGTVSRALNNRPDISEQTKRRVLEACNQLKYVPSHAARSLATGRRYAVAVLVRDLRDAFDAGFVRGVLSRAQAEHYAVHITELSLERERSYDHLRTLVSERVDSLLISRPLDEADGQQVAGSSGGDHPIISAGPLPGISCDVMASDNVESGRLVARHVLRNNDGSGVVYLYDSADQAGTQRRDGFQEVCRAAGIDPAAITINVGERDASAPDRLAPWHDRIAGARAVVAGTDELAFEAMLVCTARGRNPGQDVAIVGQGNSLCGTRIWPTLTTTDLGAEEVGQRAMDLALQRVTKVRQDAAQETHVPPTLLARESSLLLQ